MHSETEGFPGLKMVAQETESSRLKRLRPSGLLSGRGMPGPRTSKAGRLLLLSFWVMFLIKTADLPALASGGPPVQVLLALDTSGSMKTNDPRRLLPKAAALLVNLLEEQDCLGLLKFDETPVPLSELAPLHQAHRRRCLQGLAQLAPRGRYTDIPATLEAGLRLFGPPSSMPRALVLISDGQIDLDPEKGDQESAVTRLHREILPAYQKAHIAIFSVAFTAESDQRVLADLAAATRGSFLLVEKASDLHRALVWIYEKLKQPQLAPVMDHSFLIDAAVDEAMLIASRKTPDRPVELTDPLGVKITPKDTFPQVRWFATPVFDLVTISRPTPGFWRLGRIAEGEGKVILYTDLTLACPHLPEEVGGDEELMVGAAVCENGRPVTDAQFLGQTTFEAALVSPAGKAYGVKLAEPPEDLEEFWPPGARVGRFPPLETPGTAQLKVRVQGPTFRRERHFSIRVASPWYETKTVGGPQGHSRTLIFYPSRREPLLDLRGWLSLRPASGGLGVQRFKLPAHGTFSLALPGLPELKALTVDLQLRGRTPSGRPVFLRPIVSPLAPDMSASGSAPLSIRGNAGRVATKLRNFLQGRPGPGAVFQRVWLLSGLLALAGLLAGVAWLALRGRLNLGWLKPLTMAFTTAGGKSKAQELMLLARVETLLQEKAALEARLEEREECLRRAAAENAELQQKLERQSQRFQEKSKQIKELEQKLKEAEQEAKAVQEEYMALFARSQEGKQVLKKE